MIGDQEEENQQNDRLFNMLMPRKRPMIDQTFAPLKCSQINNIHTKNYLILIG